MRYNHNFIKFTAYSLYISKIQRSDFCLFFTISHAKKCLCLLLALFLCLPAFSMTEPTIKTSVTEGFTNKEQIKHKAIKLLKQAKSIRHTAPAESLKLAKEALYISTQNQS